jgi:hypothetical protein
MRRLPILLVLLVLVGAFVGTGVAHGAAPTQVRMTVPPRTMSVGSGAAWIGDFGGSGTDALAVEGRALGHDGAGTDWVGWGSWKAGSSVTLGPSFGLQIVGADFGDPHNAGPVDMRVGAMAGIGDFNGDGVADALLDRCVVLGGSPKGRSRQLSATAPLGDLCAPLLSSLRADSGGGDLDGDGLADAIVSSAGTSDGAGALVLFGHRDGAAARRLTITRPAGAVFAGAAGVGDVNGDGEDDLAIESSLGLQVVPGPIVGTTIDPARPPGGTSTLPVPYATTLLARDVEPLGDVDGDGIDDFAVSSREAYGSEAMSVGGGQDLGTIVYGASAGRPTAMTHVQWAGGAGNLGSIVAAGDLDGDGLADILVAAPGQTQAVVVYGRRARPTAIDLGHLGEREGYRVRDTGHADNGFGSIVGSAPPWIGAHRNGVLVTSGPYLRRVVIDVDPASVEAAARREGRSLRVRVRCPNAARTTCRGTATAKDGRCTTYRGRPTIAAGATTTVDLRRTRIGRRSRCDAHARLVLHSMHRTWRTTQTLHVRRTTR